MAIFPGGSGLADTSIHTDVSILDFIGVKDDGGGGADNWSYKIWKFQSYHHHQQTNTQRFIGQMPFLSPNEQCHSTQLEKRQKLTVLIQPHSGQPHSCLAEHRISLAAARRNARRHQAAVACHHRTASPTHADTHVDQHESTPYLQLRLVGIYQHFQHKQAISCHIIIIIIIRSRRQQRSVASTQSGHVDESWTIRHECWRMYCRRSAGSMNGAGVLAVAANQDQNRGQFLLLQPVIMRGGLACGHRVSPQDFTYRATGICNISM